MWRAALPIANGRLGISPMHGEKGWHAASGHITIGRNIATRSGIRKSMFPVEKETGAGFPLGNPALTHRDLRNDRP
jgi:hypothetical protein